MSTTTVKSYAADLAAIRAAAARIAPFAHRTPVMTCATIDALAGRRLYFKCEHLQKIGAFKFRGACNAVMKFSDEEAKRGVVTHSSGNHAQALALAARLRDIAAHIVMPRTASPVKRQAVEGYGARVILCEPDTLSRESAAEAVRAETGATMIHPYNHPDVIAGQGTAALEFIEEIPHLEAIIAPVGGGGLLSGTAIAAKGLGSDCAPCGDSERRGEIAGASARRGEIDGHPASHRTQCNDYDGIRVFAGEPKNADDAARSMAENRIVPQPTAPRTIADGLLTSLGPLTFAIIRDHVERIITVSEDEIIAAMRLAWERAKLLIEPSAAVPLAAMLSVEGRAVAGARHVGIILSGGNVNLDALPWAAAKG